MSELGIGLGAGLLIGIILVMAFGLQHLDEGVVIDKGYRNSDYYLVVKGIYKNKERTENWPVTYFEWEQAFEGQVIKRTETRKVYK